MPNLYARQTALTNIGGRIDYISNPNRQEHLLAAYDGAADLADGTYWRQLALECQEASKYTAAGKRTVEGREIHFAVSNSLLDRMTPGEIVKVIAADFQEKYNRPATVALHWNKVKSNLHVHLIYSERELLPEPIEKTAPRALFFDEQGKRRYKKAEILDSSGNVRAGCRIVAKGEVYERKIFGAVDHRFGDQHQDWLKIMKAEWLLPLLNGKLRGDVIITEYSPENGKLAYQHVGNRVKHAKNGADIRSRIEEYNAEVKAWNENVDKGLLPVPVAVKLQPVVAMQPKKNSLIKRINEFIRNWWDVEIRAKALNSKLISRGLSFLDEIRLMSDDPEAGERIRWLHRPAVERIANALKREFLDKIPKSRKIALSERPKSVLALERMYDDYCGRRSTDRSFPHPFSGAWIFVGNDGKEYGYKGFLQHYKYECAAAGVELREDLRQRVQRMEQNRSWNRG